MDAVIASFSSCSDRDLRLCFAHGVAYQADLDQPGRLRVAYDAGYFEKVCAYEGSAIARAVNAGRIALVKRHLPPGGLVLDYGAGSGAFVRDARAGGLRASGFEVMPDAIARLTEMQAFDSSPRGYDAVTLWDCIEHLEDPGACLASVDAGALLFVSVPIFEDLARIRDSKHYRPGEHLYYWTARGFIRWIRRYGFHLLEQSHHETAAGRDAIAAFAFRRDA